MAVPSSYFLFEEYIRELASVQPTPFMRAKKLGRVAKMFGLKNEFTQVKNLFKNLGSIYFFFSEDLSDEVAVLKPEEFVNTIFSLLKHRSRVSTSLVPTPSSTPPSSVPISGGPTPLPSILPAPVADTELTECDVAHMPGIFPHFQFKDIWGSDPSFFSDILALLERNGILFNFYNSVEGISPSSSIMKVFYVRLYVCMCKNAWSPHTHTKLCLI
jgi:hypothetical protein